jgi:hypothetical protein
MGCNARKTNSEAGAHNEEGAIKRFCREKEHIEAYPLFKKKQCIFLTKENKAGNVCIE